MGVDTSTVITPVTATIETDEFAKVELGSASREALRIEQVSLLRLMLDEITEFADQPLDNVSRTQHEDLLRCLREAERASSALWWLVPSNLETAEDE